MGKQQQISRKTHTQSEEDWREWKKYIRENHVPMIIVHKLSRMTTLWRNKKKKCVKIIMTMMLIIVTYFFWSFLPSHANRRVIVGLWCWRDSDKSNYSLRQLRVFGREGHCCAWFLLFITFTVFFGKISNRWTNHVFWLLSVVPHNQSSIIIIITRISRTRPRYRRVNWIHESTESIWKKTSRNECRPFFCSFFVSTNRQFPSFRQI